MLDTDHRRRSICSGSSCIRRRHEARTDTRGTVHLARAVIVATGSCPRRLGVPGEDELSGRGVYVSALCDDHTVRDRDAVVVGGGDGALHEALLLADVARTVGLLRPAGPRHPTSGAVRRERVPGSVYAPVWEARQAATSSSRSCGWPDPIIGSTFRGITRSART
ncbi:NAD(P)/FAD-dependent oxidoreductase [Kitasatospora sp. NPDC058170]|uniref:NAD(P)/FAD-dependent oxidoreductase n=1 Tax=Kitasatospora sp. NPDC058170 TaxID=3346364 RepID=UPI0036D848BD